MELNPNSYVVLGTLRLGARSGYEVRRWVERSASFFWTISPPQVYPELKRLEQAGYVKGKADPQGARARRTYRVTAAGERALREWLRSGDELAFELRDRGLLKLFFADALEPEEALAHVRALRARAERELARFGREIHPAAVREQERTGNRFPAITARFALDFQAWVVGWCDEVERELAGRRGRRARTAPPRVDR